MPWAYHTAMDVNRSNITLDLIDVGGKTINDSVRVEIRNTRLSSLNQAFQVAFAGKSETLDGVPAFPTGSAELLLLPKRYLLKKLLIHVPAGRTLDIREMLIADPDAAKPVFPSFTKLPEDALRILRDSAFKAADWDGLKDEQRAGFMNVCAKARAVEVDGKPVIAFFNRVSLIKPARSFVLVKPELHDAVVGSRQFNPADGSLHEFEVGGFQRFQTAASFKTPDKAGNLQITFAHDTSDEKKVLVDADLDDHAGVAHFFDVLKHAITRSDTNPYNIHQVLVHFQGIDPGYSLFPEQAAPRKRRAGG